MSEQPEWMFRAKIENAIRSYEWNVRHAPDDAGKQRQMDAAIDEILAVIQGCPVSKKEGV